MSVELFAVPLPREIPRAQCDALCAAAGPDKRALYRRGPDNVYAQQSLTAQVLLRIAAARVLRMPVPEVQIAYTDAGQPILPGTSLHCSVSHTDGLCVCALSAEPVGVDAERLRPANDRVARRVFTPSEYARLQESEDYDRCFFTFWTQHESFVKLRGTGLRDISVPIPETVRMQTMVFRDTFVITCASFTETS